MAEQQEQPIKVLEGISKRVELYPDCLMLIPNNVFAQLGLRFFGECEAIPIHDIQEIHFNEPRRISGLMRLIIMRPNHSHCDIIFNSRNLKAAQELRAAVEQLISERETVAQRAHWASQPSGV